MFTTVGNRGTMHLGLCLRVLILAALTVPIRAAQPAQMTFTLTVPDGPTSTLSGSSVSLLCQVSPLFNAESLEVRWYRSSNYHSPALLYKDHKIQEAPLDPQYRGRVSLTGGMERGNVSLTLERVTLEDRGEYVCQVTSEQWYEKASVFLTVNVTGSEPVLSVAEARGGGGQLNVTCSSAGWSPQPKLTWRNKDGAEIRNGQEVLNSSDPQGLVSVSSWLLYAPSYSDWLACTVSLSEEAKREGRILPHTYTAPTAAPGVSKEAFIVTLILLVLSMVIICALCSVILWKRRGSMWSSSQKSRNRSDQTELGQKPAETKNLIEGAENTIPRPTDQRAAGKEVNLEETKKLIEGAENTIPRPTDQRAAGKEVNLEETKKRIEGAENTVPTPPKQKAAGKELNLEGAPLGAENTVLTPPKQKAAGKEFKLEGAENTVPRPTEQRADGKQVNLEETKNLIEGAENTVPRPTEQRADGKELNLKENIILDEKTAHPAIRVNRGNQAHYTKEKDTEPSVRMHLHVFSKESFSSGQHYWEVKVKDQSTEKLSWYVGVARENVERSPPVHLTTQNGFWILSFDKEKGFHVNTDPQSPITVAELTIVGVFLDCDRHTLSFYNVNTESLLYTFTDVKTSNYFPVFSPGQRDKTPIRII
ncbi:butyrophilin subfamily 3 member A1-like [Salvelinus alpinus]